MKILLTAGSTREPIDPVRYLGNRSSGKMGAAIAAAAIAARHEVILVAGPAAINFPDCNRRIDIETADEMLQAVLKEFPGCDLLIMAAAVADFRPASVSTAKLDRRNADHLTLQLVPTIDIAAAAGALKTPKQRTVGFSLETSIDLPRVQKKLAQKNLDLIVHNTTATLGSQDVLATLVYADGRIEKLSSRPKTDFADILLQRAVALF